MLVDWQFQGRQQRRTSSRAVTCDMFGRAPSVDVERRPAAREELAVDHPLGKTLGAAKAKLRTKLVQTLGDQPLVARPESGEAIADHDPVGVLLVHLAALVARLAHLSA